MYKALEDINKKANEEKAVILLCDGGEKYLNNVFNDEWMEKNNLIDKKIEKVISSWIEEA